MALDLVFCGTPNFAVPTIESVAKSFNLRLVVTQPDRPKGRKLELVASPVKIAAEKLSLPIYQPEKIKHNEELKSRLAAIQPDAIIVVSYGRIIPTWMLTGKHFTSVPKVTTAWVAMTFFVQCMTSLRENGVNR